MIYFIAAFIQYTLLVVSLYCSLCSLSRAYTLMYRLTLDIIDSIFAAYLVSNIKKKYPVCISGCLFACRIVYIQYTSSVVYYLQCTLYPVYLIGYFSAASLVASIYMFDCLFKAWSCMQYTLWWSLLQLVSSILCYWSSLRSQICLQHTLNAVSLQHS